MTQLVCDLAPVLEAGELPETTDAAIVPVGETVFYVVTANNLVGESGFADGAAVPQVNDSQCP